MEEHLGHINLVLQRLADSFGEGCVHPDKSVFASQRVEYLGYTLLAGGTLLPQAAKVQAFLHVMLRREQHD